MGNLRSNGENGSTVRSPNQDSVIGQISVGSVSFLCFCPVSITFSLNVLVCWKPNLWHKCSFSSPNSSITVLSLLAILQRADRSEDQIWQMRVSAECGGHAISKRTRKTLNSVSVCFSSMSPFFTCSLNITFGDYLMGILLSNLLILTDPCTDSFACMGSSNQELIHVGDQAPRRTRSQEPRITTGDGRFVGNTDSDCVNLIFKSVQNTLTPIERLPRSAHMHILGWSRYFCSLSVLHGLILNSTQLYEHCCEGWMALELFGFQIWTNVF